MISHTRWKMFEIRIRVREKLTEGDIDMTSIQEVQESVLYDKMNLPMP